MMWTFQAVFLSVLCTLTNGETPVYILAENLEQVVTSSTLQWIPNYLLNDTMLQDAVIASYQVVREGKVYTEPIKP